MKDFRHIVMDSPAARGAAAALAVLCVGATVFAAAQLGGEAFDPSAFLDAQFNRQSQPDFDAAFDVERSEENGDANMQADEDEPEKREQPDVQEVNATSFSRSEGSGSSALTVVDGPASGGTVAGGSSGEGGSDAGHAVGPIVNGGSDGSEGEGPNGEGPGGDEPGGDGPGPDDPDDPAPQPPVDPDPRPTLPDDMYEDAGIIETHPFPEEGVVPTPDDEGNVSITFLALTDDNLLGDDEAERLGMERIYHGMILDEWKLLCATFFYVSVNGTTYRLENYGDNFKAGEFPAIVDGDSFDVDFFFRFNSRSAWEKHTVTYRVHPCKVMMQGWEEGSYVRARYPDAGASVDLSDLYGQMLPDGVADDPFASASLSFTFPGWSETRGGRPLGSSYTPSAKGRVVLYPVALQPVPSEFEVVYTWGRQTLMGYTGAGGVCSLPDGVQSIELLDPIVADVVRIPASLQYGMSQLQARCSYEVAAGNVSFYAQDGMLIDAESGIVLGVPSLTEEVVVPASAPAVIIPEDNAIKRIVLSEPEAGIDPTDVVDVRLLHGADIVVPADRYLEFLAAWGAAPGDGTNRLLPDSGESPDYVVRDGAILSADGATLYQALPSVLGTFFVPEGVVTVKEGAFAASPLIETVVLPGSVAVVERKGLAGDALTRVLFEGALPPAVDAQAFGAVEAHVRPKALAAYREAWSVQLGADATEALLVVDDFETPEIDGYRLLLIALEDENGSSLPGDEAIVASAPADATEFSAATLGDVAVTSIGSGAFKGCASLEQVELPAGVTSIGRDAFAECTRLEAFLSAAPDTIAIGASAFDECPSLRIAVFDAQAADVADWDSLYWGGFRAYAPYGSTGYEDGAPNSYQRVFDASFQDLTVSRQNGGMLLYGTEVEYAQRCLLRATSGIAGDVALETGVEVLLESAFSDCANPFAIDAASLALVEEVGAGAFARSGLTRATLSPVCGYLGSGAFSDCALLETVTFETDADGASALKTVPDSAFSDCSKLTSVAFPASVESVGYGVFSGAAVNDVAFCSEEPPTLVMPSFGVDYVFSDDPPEDFRIRLVGDAQADRYVETWKFYLIGRSFGDELSPEEDLEGANRARALLGLPPLDEASNASAASEPPAAPADADEGPADPTDDAAPGRLVYDLAIAPDEEDNDTNDQAL